MKSAALFLSLSLVSPFALAHQWFSTLDCNGEPGKTEAHVTWKRGKSYEANVKEGGQMAYQGKAKLDTKDVFKDKTMFDEHTLALGDYGSLVFMTIDKPMGIVADATNLKPEIRKVEAELKSKAGAQKLSCEVEFIPEQGHAPPRPKK